MSIKAKLTPEEFGALGDPLKGLYAKQADGSYLLDAEGVEDVTGLKSALGSERQKAKDLDAQLKALQTSMSGVDLEAYKKWLQDTESNTELKLIKEGKIDEVFQRRTEKMRQTHEGEVKSLRDEVQRLTDAVNSITSELGSTMIDSGIAAVAPRLGVKPSAIHDLTSRARSVWKTEKGQDGKIALVPYKDGTVYYGKTGGKPVTFEEWIASLTSDAAHLFEPNKGTGTPGTGTTQILGSGHRITREAARNPREYQAAKERAEKAGVALEIVDQ